ncbi:MAG: choice-of-anchor tandem repeat NxxGxxAF-containing protein [Nitrospirota bacterium]|nr:choice-of-anchor tandem repeat NxxGxxAF-containing protein [Nitrospirota bacterium]
MKILGVCGLLCLAVPGLWQSSIPSEPYELYRFVAIADSQSGQFRSFHPTPAIDSQGMAIFRANLIDGGQGIFMGNEAGQISIADTTGEYQLFRGTPALSHNGKVLFQSDAKSGVVGYFRGSNPEHDFVYGNPEFENIGEVAINNNGMVAFKARRKSGREKRRQVFLGTGGTPKAVPESAHSQVGVPDLNDRGAVVFSTGAQVFMSDGTTTLSILKKDKKNFLFHRPVINDEGSILVQVSLRVQDAQMGKKLVLVDKGKQTVLASTETQYAEFFGAHSLNNHGQIAFSALLDSGITGIFTGPDPVHDTVILQGDELAGSRILEGPVLSNHSLNDDGVIVFFARLEDDSEGIFLAKPQDASFASVLSDEDF